MKADARELVSFLIWSCRKFKCLMACYGCLLKMLKAGVSTSPPPCLMKYCSILSQSIFVRQKMMAWSILCSLMALTAYSPFRILIASDHISDKGIKQHCFISGQIKVLFQCLEYNIQIVTWAVGSRSCVVLCMNFISLWGVTK